MRVKFYRDTLCDHLSLGFYVTFRRSTKTIFIDIMLLKWWFEIYIDFRRGE